MNCISVLQKIAARAETIDGRKVAWKLRDLSEADLGGTFLGNDVRTVMPALSALLVPQGMAYAELAGLPAVTGTGHATTSRSSRPPRPPWSTRRPDQRRCR